MEVHKMTVRRMTTEEWEAKQKQDVDDEEERKRAKWEARFREKYPGLNPVTWSSGRGRGGMQLNPHLATTLDPLVAERIVEEEFRDFRKRVEERFKQEEVSASPDDLWFEWNIEFQVDPMPQWRQDYKFKEGDRQLLQEARETRDKKQRNKDYRSK